jgi:DNA-binding NarL/FixJ family response regulator
VKRERARVDSTGGPDGFGLREDGPVKTRHKQNDDLGVPVTAVVVIAAAGLRREVSQRLTGCGIACVTAEDPAHAATLMAHGEFDVVVMDAASARMSTGTRKTLKRFGGVRALSAAHPSTGVVVVAERCGLDDAIAAMQAGAADMIPAETDAEEMTRRVLAAATRSAGARGLWAKKERREARLRRLCKGLNSSRHELSRQVSSLCENLAGAYKELAEQMTSATLASEFNSLIRQELDLESLLRVGVEYMLGKSGPTNAAVFLPAANGDYSLGAYVNYDRPKDSAELLMDQLAAGVAPRVDGEEGVLVMNSAPELSDHLGDAAEWLEEMSVVTATCRHEGECLAVIAMFRPRSAPFSDEFARTLSVIAGLFAKQLSKVIHVHHRHLPKHKWGMPGDTGEDHGGADDIDLAA